MSLITEMYNNRDYNESLFKHIRRAVQKVKKHYAQKQMYKKADKSRERNLKRKLIKDLGRKQYKKALTSPMSFEF